MEDLRDHDVAHSSVFKVPDGPYALSTRASGVGDPCSASISFSRDPPLMPIRIAAPLSLALGDREQALKAPDVPGIHPDFIGAHLKGQDSQTVIKVDIGTMGRERLS